MRSLLDRAVRWIGPRLALAYLRLFEATSRTEWVGAEYARALEQQGQNYIYGLWHGRQVFLIWAHRGVPAAAMASRSRDGDLIADVLTRLGVMPVRGSSSKGGATALKGLVDAARGGLRPAITPDGPRGPMREVKDGILFLAQELGIPILPISGGLRRKLVFRGWDEMEVPLPFTRGVVVYEKPIWVRPGDSLEAKARELKRALDEATRQADSLASK